MSAYARKMNLRQAIVWELLGDSWDHGPETERRRVWAADLLGISIERFRELETEAADRIRHEFQLLEQYPDLDP
jgi:hypothetical protein